MLVMWLIVSMVAGVTAGAGGWKNAQRGRVLSFPADHASHPEYKIEWWYYTGNLFTAAGRRFGYQLTFFRIGVDFAPVNPSRWAVRDLYMAHLAVTDVAAGRHLAAERLNRAGVGWAGAERTTYRVWNEDWTAHLEGATHRLRATDAAIGVDLTLAPRHPPVLHGDGGYSQKGSQLGNASHYYSLTRIPTSGTLTIGGDRFSVSGLSWMDHEFGTTVLEEDQLGWDWLSLQLDDGHDVMLYQFRRRGGARDPRSSGTLVLSSRPPLPLRADDFTLVPGRVWSSPATGARYPVEWRLTVPGHRLDLHIRAVVDAQELDMQRSTGITYWEGAIDVTGTSAGRPIRGRGYLEMTGYSGRPMGTVLR